MSKHSTECLIDKLKYWKGVVAIDDDYIDEVIARLRAADKLCEAAKELLEVQFVTAGIGYKRGKKVVKAIADYEEGRNR